MKTATQPLQQFSSNLLQPVSHLQTVKKNTLLVPVKIDEKRSITNFNINDPANWDTDWFSNYE